MWKNLSKILNDISGKLLHYQQECLENIANDDRASFNSNLQNHFLVFQSILAYVEIFHNMFTYFRAF